MNKETEKWIVIATERQAQIERLKRVIENLSYAVEKAFEGAQAVTVAKAIISNERAGRVLLEPGETE